MIKIVFITFDKTVLESSKKLKMKILVKNPVVRLL